MEYERFFYTHATAQRGLGMPILQPGSEPVGGLCGSLNRLTALKSPTATFALQYTLAPTQLDKIKNLHSQIRSGTVAVCRKLDVRFSITIRQHKSLHNLIEAIPEDAWTPVPYWMDGAADVAEITYTPFQSEPDAAPVRLIVRRVKPTPGSQLALFATYSYHGFITDRDGETLELEADHRRHAEIENAIRDLKYGVGLNHLPSGRFAANAAWLAVQVMAHNLARWTARIGLGEQTVTTKTLRQRVFALARRITRSARRLTLHLPKSWPCQEKVSRALARLRAIPLPT